MQIQIRKVQASGVHCLRQSTKNVNLRVQFQQEFPKYFYSSTSPTKVKCLASKPKFLGDCIVFSRIKLEMILFPMFISNCPLSLCTSWASFEQAQHWHHHSHDSSEATFVNLLSSVLFFRSHSTISGFQISLKMSNQPEIYSNVKVAQARLENMAPIFWDYSDSGLNRFLT